MALHASRSARERFGLRGRAEFAGGKIVLRTAAAARGLAAALREVDEGTREVSAGELNALARVEETLQLVVSRHLREQDPAALEELVEGARRRLGVAEAERLFSLFGSDFSLPSDSGVLLRELLVWWALDESPAASPVTRRLFAGEFRSDGSRTRLLDALRDSAISGSRAVASLIDLLHAPSRAAPDSLSGHLRFLVGRWEDVVGMDRVGLLRGLDLLAEESKGAPPGPGPAEVPAFDDLEDEPEAFSRDDDWMRDVVLLARNVFVWLDQLSRRFERPIRRLDEIPDESLDEVAARGFTGLWLIGVWERSAASERLKRLCGNPEAAASAYSLRGYRIADEVGGEAALDALIERSAARGIRLAADMVPNHMGIDSDWVMHHPERFLALPESPFATYTFDGPDLSPDPAVGIYVEDRYYDRSDAAVVFKRVDRGTGERSFVYHGNDGTATPWNDTAQLDYLDPATREAVIQTILDVARRFPIIRFDAAMTLARRHIQRLWFPVPGSGGAVPSRAEHGLSAERFAQLLPVEFWREVVDRVADEAPGTLLLAEAFWLMEGYFVRSLGMHRVYNSAFMNMLRDGENAKLRQLIKETLSFDPRILRRYVNFLTNPDEETAREQFGAGDRYFGACVVLATLPGLPLFGHGQFEGHSEKYGMEYRRAYAEEAPDSEIPARHEREIVPLLVDRRRFAGVESFELFDLVDEHGVVNEEVLAFSNGRGPDAVLVLFNNSADPARGRLSRSAPRAGREGAPLGAVLDFGVADGVFAFSDRISGSTFLGLVEEVDDSGLEVVLDGYGYRVLERFRPVEHDDQEAVRGLAARLGGLGVEDLDAELAEIAKIAEESAASTLRGAIAGLAGVTPLGLGEPLRETFIEDLRKLLDGLPGGRGRPEDGLPPDDAVIERRLRSIDGLTRLADETPFPDTERMRLARRRFEAWLAASPELYAALATTHVLATLAPRRATLASPGFAGLAGALEELGIEAGLRAELAAVVRLALERNWAVEPTLPAARDLATMRQRWAADPDLGLAGDPVAVAVADGRLEDLVRWRTAVALAATAEVEDRGARAELVVGWIDVMQWILDQPRPEPGPLPSDTATSAASE